MTSEQRNDLCIEWECTSTIIRQSLLEEYQDNHAAESHWEDWEDFLVRRLRMKQFWQTVGLL